MTAWQLSRDSDGLAEYMEEEKGGVTQRLGASRFAVR